MVIAVERYDTDFPASFFYKIRNTFHHQGICHISVLSIGCRHTLKQRCIIYRDAHLDLLLVHLDLGTALVLTALPHKNAEQEQCQ